MRSPIARCLVAAAHLLEWCHRRIHGPKFAPGDVVEVKHHPGEWEVIEVDDFGLLVSSSKASGLLVEPDFGDIIRVVRYAGGE